MAPLVALSAVAFLGPAAPDADAWLLPGIDKVRPDTHRAGDANEPLVVAARGERRGFQLAIRIPQRAGVQLTVGPWLGRGLGSPVVYREATVRVRRTASGHPMSNLGLWPDVLVRMRSDSVDLPAGTTVFWIDVSIPENVPAGRYRLAVSVFSHQLSMRSAATFRVVAATPRSRLVTLVGLSDRNGGRLDLIRTLASFRLRAAEWSSDRDELRRLLRLQSVVALPGQTDPVHSRASLRRAMALLRSLGAARRNVAYVGDEPTCSDLPAVERAARAARGADPLIRPLVTISPAACDGTAERILKSVRIFVPTERDAEPAGVLGRTRWLYPNNANAGSGFTTFAIDDPGAATLLTAWRAGVVGARGILYWAADRWADGGDPLQDAWNPALGQEYNGDGVLVYPGGSPSLRLALFREGAEDYELARCAGSRGREILRSIAPAPRRLNADSGDILRARLALALACAAASRG